MKFLCVGQCMCDMYIYPAGPEIFDGTEARDHLIKSIDIFCGGDAANASCDLAKLGEEVALASALGDDAFGNRLLGVFKEAGVDGRFIHMRQDLPTTVHTIILRDGARGNTFLEGCAEQVSPDDIAEEGIDWADHVHMVSVLSMPNMDGDGKGVADVVRKAKEKGKTTSMDLDLWGDLPFTIDRIDEALHYVDVFLPSILEVKTVTGLTDPMEIKEYFSRYNFKIFGVKLGEKGVFLTNFKEDIFLPSLVKGIPIDPLGAGDAFCSGFISAWKRGYDLESCGLVASAASCKVCNMIGCSKGMVSFEELVEFLKGEGYEVRLDG